MCHKIIISDKVTTNFIDEIEIVLSPRLPWPLNYDNFASMCFANFDYHKNSAEENGVMENDVGVVKSEGRNDDWIEENGKSVERAVSCTGDSYFEVSFDGN